jgi:hypothetical protein
VARCTYHEFHSNGIDLNQLIDGINASLDTGYITEGSLVAIEAHGGNGTNGRWWDNSDGGKGGSGGYAVSLQTVSTLRQYAANFTEFTLWVYPGLDGVNDMSGGASSIAMLQPITEITSDTKRNPSAAGVLVIAGGGGGGGHAGPGTIFHPSHMGLDGGDGGKIVGVADEDDWGVGSDGSSSSQVTGGGGGGDYNGVGGMNTKFPNENYGTPGAGGQGGLAYDQLTCWNKAPATPDCTWGNGKGGPSVGGGGAGGGGYGGGGSGQGTTSKSGGAGGGGGGSFAMATDASLPAPPDGLLEGHSAATNSIVVSFEILP